jgi:hypothetical protein
MADDKIVHRISLEGAEDVAKKRGPRASPCPRRCLPDPGQALVGSLAGIRVQMGAASSGLGPRSTCCGLFIARLIKKHGRPHVTIVLRTIVESIGNESELIADVIAAASSR